MKKYFINFLRLVGSRLVYLFIGLSFAVLIIAVNAAVTISTTPATTGTPLTKAKWDAMVTDLNNLATTVNGMTTGFTTCTTKVSTTNWYNGAGDGRFWSTIDCDPGWTMTGGGCLVNDFCWSKLLAQSYPTANGWICAQQTSGCDNNGPYTYVRCCR